MEPSLLLVAVLGGLLALDETAVAQIQVSRPLVAGTLAGWALGVPLLGGLIGSLLELYALAILPTGGARFPGLAPATVAAVGSVALAGSGGAGDLALAFGLALGLGEIDAITVQAMRRLNGRWIPDGSTAKPSLVVWAHLTGLVADFLRASLVTFGGGAVGIQLISRFGGQWSLSEDWAVALILLGSTVSLGALLRAFGGWRSRRLIFAIGLLLGTGAGLLL